MEHIPDWVKNCLKNKGGLDGNEVDAEWNKVIVMDPPTLMEFEQPLEAEEEGVDLNGGDGEAQGHIQESES